MVLLVKLLAVAIIIFGCIEILRPKTQAELIERMKKGNRLYAASGIKFVVGIFLMIASRYCSIPWIILLWGALTTFGCAVAFLVKKNALLKLMEWVEKKPIKYVYLHGALCILVGVSIVLGA
ncbi:hypothetical protein ACFL5E_01575 [Candidatus Omnitrophota bacterium]